MVQTVKNLAAMQDTRVGSLGGEDPLEKGMATHSSILAWEIPWTESLAAIVCGVAKKPNMTGDIYMCMCVLDLKLSPTSFSIHQ